MSSIRKHYRLRDAFRAASIMACFSGSLVFGAGHWWSPGQTSNAQAVSEKPELILQTVHSQKSEGVAFSPDGRYVATGSVDHTIKIWEAATGRELRTLAGHIGT